MIGFHLFQERDHAGNQPLVPHLVHFALEVINVVVSEVREATLPEQVVAHREPLVRSEEHTSELQSQSNLVCRLLLEKKKKAYKYDMRDHIQIIRRTAGSTHS